ncbi:MAG: biopolymer transporter ExbD [Puniceicoccaceae bacterium]|nr:MAG: biopolymer transporter ExbD [Puniceicoccaceae bacterium]
MSLMLRKRRRAEINIIPLMDVLTILIFFFLVSMQFRDIAALNLVLPRIETAGRSEIATPLVVGINVEGTITYNGQVVSPEQLEFAAARQAEADSSITVLLQADEATPLKSVTLVMDILRKNGLNRIRLQSR